MTDPERVARAFATHGAFERDDEGFDVRTTALDATVQVDESDRRVVVTVRVPTIDAVVAGETVAPVVQEGWFETFERRLEDVGGVTVLDPGEPRVSLDEREAQVVVKTSLPAERASVVVEDAKAVVDYVEGTFAEGIIPGYTYREPAAGLVERARSAGER